MWPVSYCFCSISVLLDVIFAISRAYVTFFLNRINGFWVDDFENRDGTRSSSLLGFANSWEANGLICCKPLNL